MNHVEDRPRTPTVAPVEDHVRRRFSWATKHLSDIDDRDPATLQRQLAIQEDRDYQLWSIAVLALIVVSAAFAAILFPTVLWGSETNQLRGRYLPTLLFGFIALIVLFNIYLIGQRRTLRRTRLALIAQMVRADEAVAQSFIDPLTHVFNRHYMEHLIPREVKRTDRLDGVLALLMVDVNAFKAVNSRFGHLEGDLFLQQVARVLKSTFRGSDTIIRFGGDEFLVVMPDTSEDGAQLAIARLLDAVAAWNAATESNRYCMSLSCGAACYRRGDTVDRVLDLADRRMYDQKARQRAIARSPSEALHQIKTV